MFQRGCNLELLARFFRLADHLQVKATGTFARNICLEESLWADITSREFDGFGLSPALLKPSGWKMLARLFRKTKQAQITVDHNPCVHFEESADPFSPLQQLIGSLRYSNQSTSCPKSFVGVMRFPRGSLPSTLDDGRRPRPENAQTPTANPQSGIGEAFSLLLDLPDDPLGDAHSSVRKKPAELTLHFGWQSNHLFVCVRNDRLPPGELWPEDGDEFRNSLMVSGQRGGSMISLDIATCSSAMTLHHRSVCVVMNGPWTKCNTGLFFMRAGSDAALDALAKGVPCVVCARYAQANDYQRMVHVPALHLDSVRQQ